jgi:hypothetical protein
MSDISPLTEWILENAPRERDPRYFRCWQRVSLNHQGVLREAIVDGYFHNASRFDDREIANSVLVYSACRLCYGRPRTEFTFDLADPRLIPSATYNIGTAFKQVLETVSMRLRELGKKELSGRYSAIWAQDILRSVRARPRVLLSLLACESQVIDAIIDLGTSGDVRRFHRTSKAALRSVLGNDMQHLIEPLLEQTGRILEGLRAEHLNNLLHRGLHERDRAFAAWRPYARVRGAENGDDGNADGSRQMRDAAIVPQISPRASEPAGELIKVIVSDSILEQIFGSGNPSHLADLASDGSKVA